jgi:hypothetical protein
MAKPLMADPVKHGYRSELFAATDPEVVEGEGVHGQYIMPDKKISEVGKKGQDVVMAARLWDLGIGLLKDERNLLRFQTSASSCLAEHPNTLYPNSSHRPKSHQFYPVVTPPRLFVTHFRLRTKAEVVPAFCPLLFALH